jgi:hypothetical protein
MEVTANVFVNPLFPEAPARFYDAPDVGAYSGGEALPVYGPRP